MRRVVIRNGVISAAFEERLPSIGTFPKPIGERKGTLMVYLVDREKLKREDNERRSA